MSGKQHVRKGQRVPDEHAEELVPAVHVPAALQATLAGTHHSAVDSDQRSSARPFFVCDGAEQVGVRSSIRRVAKEEGTLKAGVDSQTKEK